MGIQQLMLIGGAAAPRVELGGTKAHIDFSFAPADSHAGFRVHSDGSMDGTAANSLNWAIDDGTWLLSGAAGDYEVRATLVSGNLTSGTTGTWLNCGTTREWSCSVTGLGTVVASLTIELRDASTLEVLDSCGVDLEASVEP